MTTQRLRSVLTALGIAVGIAAVVLLTAIGEGLHRMVLAEFADFGTQLIAVTPGITKTKGVVGGVVTNVRPLTIDDAESLRRIRGVSAVVPQIQGNVAVKIGKRSRRATLLGVGHELPELWQIQVAKGRFLPDADPAVAPSVAVLGNLLARELFGQTSPLGQLIRIDGERYRVIGVMHSKGQMLGVDLDDAVYVPAARAMATLDRDSLMEISLLVHRHASVETVSDSVRAALALRHGTEDFSITTQDVMLEKLGSILGMITVTIGGLGAISLLVGSVGILTIMTISVSERTAEIGLMRALGARRRQIMVLFLIEAMTLSGLGGLAGLALGILGAWLLSITMPMLPVYVSTFYVAVAVLLSLAIGLLAGVSPARHAALLDPVEALRTE